MVRKLANQLLMEYPNYYETVYFDFIVEAVENSLMDNGRQPFESLQDLHNHIIQNYI